jgi:hypothetical protein
VKLTTHVIEMPSLKITGVIPPPPPYACMVCIGTNLYIQYFALVKLIVNVKLCVAMSLRHMGVEV